MINIILASKSEIRKQMLEEADIPFEVIVSDADETPDLSKSFGEQLQDISMRKAKIVFEKTINNYDILRISMDILSDEKLEDYLKNSKPLTRAGGIMVKECDFIHLQEGRLSTAYGMTIEYLQEMIKEVQ